MEGHVELQTGEAQVRMDRISNLGSKNILG